MPADRKRQQTVKEAVAYLRQHLDDEEAPDDGIRVQSLAEALALLAAEARAAGIDEGLAAEIILKASGFTRETLSEARHILGALGYGDIAAVIKRLARTAPRRLTFEERMRKAPLERMPVN